MINQIPELQNDANNILFDENFVDWQRLNILIMKNSKVMIIWMPIENKIPLHILNVDKQNLNCCLRWEMKIRIPLLLVCATLKMHHLIFVKSIYLYILIQQRIVPTMFHHLHHHYQHHHHLFRSMHFRRMHGMLLK